MESLKDQLVLLVTTLVEEDNLSSIQPNMDLNNLAMEVLMNFLTHNLL